VLISVEDIEDDEAKAAETAFMDAFAARVLTWGLEAGWAPILPTLAPVIGVLVADAIPRSNPASIAAAAAIGGDRLIRSVGELAGIRVPTLVIPGIDDRHPTAIARAVADILPTGTLAATGMSRELRNAEDLADAFAPLIARFLQPR
jgi:hypothetical protein